MQSAILILSQNNKMEGADIQNWYEQYKLIEVLEAKPDELGFCSETLDRLLPHCKSRDFDVLLVPSFEILGFSEFMCAQIIERVVKSKAEIQVLNECITEDNYHQWLPKDYPKLDDLKNHRGRWHKVYFELRVRRGLPANRHVPDSHIVVLNDDEQEIGLELNPATQAMWLDLATLILEQLSWKEIGREMYKRFGHTNPEGQPYSHKYFYDTVYTPAFWGNSAFNFKNHRYGAWVYQKGMEIPEGVIVQYNTHVPVWSEKRANKIKEELDRRAEIGHDDGLPSEILDGLLLCAECANPLKMYVDGMWLVWRCKIHSDDISPVLKDRTALKYIKKRVSEFLTVTDVDQLLPKEVVDRAVLKAEMDNIDNQISAIALHTEKFYSHLVNVHSTIIEQAYMEMIILVELAEESFHERRERLEQVFILSQIMQYLQDGTLSPENVLQESYERFWLLPPKTINNLLSRLMNGQKFVVMDGEIVGISR